MTETTTPAERYERMTRPLLFVRVRLYRGGQAEAIRDILREEQDRLYDDLGEFRAAGREEEDEELVEVKDTLRYIINALKDIDQGLIDLVGPNSDPRLP